MSPSADPVAVPHRHCPLCRRARPFEHVFARGPYVLVRCPSCRLVFQDPQPSERALAAGYYEDPAFTAELMGSLREWTLAQARTKLGLLARTAGPLTPGRALDVGCSSGAWLEVAAEAGWRATGVELGASTAAAARERGLDVRTGTLAQLVGELEPERFDLITYWDVLEHVRDPRAELELAVTLLAPGGVLAATMPNVEGWYPRLTHALLARGGGVWEHAELPLHLYDFAPATISLLLEQCGLAVVGLRTAPVPYRFYRQTVLSEADLGRGLRARLLRAAFGGLRAVVYPLADAFDRANAMAVAARRVDPAEHPSATGAPGARR